VEDLTLKTDNRIFQPGHSAAACAETLEPETAPAPFPLDKLPPAAANMARDIVRVMRGPDSLAGCCVLGALSAALGARLDVRSGPGRVTRGNLYILASAESGSGKSETFRHAIAPLLEYEGEILRRWAEQEKPGLEAKREMLQADLVRLRKQAANPKSKTPRADTCAQIEEATRKLRSVQEKLHGPRLVIEDVTSQKLAVLLAAHGECLASLSADAGEVVSILLGRYSGNVKRTDESVYLKAFTGDPCRVDRQNSETIILQRPCLSALWLTQPDKLADLLAERSLTDGGLIPRLLSCHTNCRPLAIVEDAEEFAPAVAAAYRAMIRELLESFRLSPAPVTIEARPDARRAMNEHYNSIVDRWHNGEVRDVGSFVLRWTEQAWRIAVCLHAGKHGAGAGDKALELDTAQEAIVIADWFAGQQLEILAASRDAGRRDKRERVLALLVDKPAGITARDVQRAHITNDAEEARQLLATMEAEGTLRSKEKETGGRPVRVYTRHG